MDRLFCDSLSCNVAFKCLMFMPEISNRIVFVNGKHPLCQANNKSENSLFFLEKIGNLLWQFVNLYVTCQHFVLQNFIYQVFSQNCIKQLIFFKLGYINHCNPSINFCGLSLDKTDHVIQNRTMVIRRYRPSDLISVV